MNDDLLHTQNIENIVSEIQFQYGLEKNNAYKIINDSIAVVYKSDYPVILEEDGIYAVYNDKKKANAFKYVKIKYSKQKSKLIVQCIQREANREFLKIQREKIVNFIKTKKGYFHASISHEINNDYIYDLYYDKNHKYIINRVKAKISKVLGVKKRVYIDFTSAQFEKEILLYGEVKEIRTIKNLRELTKDLSREIYEKIGKKIWIEIIGVNTNKNEVYLHLPHRTIIEIISHIKNKFQEVFGVKIVLVGKEKT